MKMPNSEIAKEVLFHLVKCIFCFYSGLFIVSTIAFGAFRLTSPYNPASPFDFTTWIDLDRCCSFDAQSKSNAAALFGAYMVLMFLLLLNIQKAHWFFITVVTILHIIISCAVKKAFPVNYSFWLCLGIFSFGCLFISDIIIFFVEENNRPDEPRKVTPDKLRSTESLQSPRGKSA